MSLEQIRIAGYRSIRNLHLRLSNLTVFTGPNGCGKSNLYRSLVLMAATARGDLAQALAEEGGMPSALWAGPRPKKGPVRMILGVTAADWDYEIAFGLPPPPQGSFLLDPDVKEETVKFLNPGRRATVMLQRKGPSAWLRDQNGKRADYPLELSQSESALSQLTDPQLYPELAYLRDQAAQWRFYHHFRTDPHSPLRQPQIGVRTPVLSGSGIDLAAALQTIIEIGNAGALYDEIDAAFPGGKLEIFQERGRFEVGLRLPGILRPFEARELSDGTLRYLCLLAVLLSPRPPALLALNEPETSIHADLLEPLARFIVRAAETTQLLVVTHSQSLAGHIAEVSGCPVLELEKVDGATEIAGGHKSGGLSWND